MPKNVVQYDLLISCPGDITTEISIIAVSYTHLAIGKRPVAVMVNNVDAALPQYGISAADLIFELPVEYDLSLIHI